MPQPLVELARALSIFLPFPLDGDWSGGWGITLLFWLGVFAFAAAMLREERRVWRILMRLSAFNDRLEHRRPGGFQSRRELEIVARDLGREVPALQGAVLALAEATFETDQGLFSTSSAEDFIDPLAFRELVDVPPGRTRQETRDGRIVGRDKAADLLDRMDDEDLDEPVDSRPKSGWGDMVDLLDAPEEEQPMPPPPRVAQPSARAHKPPVIFDLPDPEPRGLITPALVAAGPSLLTAVGILGTFIGLVMGLEAGTSAGGTGEMPIDINTLVGGLHVSFRTSVIGLVASLALTVVSKSISGRAERELGRLSRTLDAGLVRTTTHELLAHLYVRQDEAAEALRWLKRELATDALQQTLEKAIRRQVRPLLVRLHEATAASRDEAA